MLIKNFGWPAVISILILSFGFLLANQIIIKKPERSGFENKILGANINCLPEGHQRLSQHFHPHLTILIDNEPVVIPADIGIDANCMAEVHTHDSDGVLHVESASSNKTFTLGQFFAVWDQPFSPDQILDKTANEEYEILMTVNGEPNQEFGNLVLADNQRIVISYEKRSD